MESKLIAADLLTESAKRRKIHLLLLIADTGLWVSPDYYRRLLSDTGSAALFPQVKRARSGHGEMRGEFVNNIRLDDNTYANNAVKRALGLSRASVVGFEACHIWPLTCYDERYHTLVANLVLLPRALAGLSDYDLEIRRALQYRAFDLYGWWPEGQDQPVKPGFYPPEWRKPQPDPVLSSTRYTKTRTAGVASTERQRSLNDRIKQWAAKPSSNVHKIIAIMVNSEKGLTRDELVRHAEVATGSKNAYGAVASLMSNSGNAYGQVLEVEGKCIQLNSEVADVARSLTWSAG